MQRYRDVFFYLFLQGLLLLQQLTKSNAAIQKIVAFENAFERLLDIITEEGSSDGGKKVSQNTSVMVFFCGLLITNTCNTICILPMDVSP